jgi:thiamine biosynthesis protein ThiS
MHIKVNGEDKDIERTTIAGIFQELEINPRGMLVHANGTVVHWTKYDSFQIHENDRVEIIRFIGGG